jgi:two-component system, LuxR family, sensor kinase FixL
VDATTHLISSSGFAGASWVTILWVMIVSTCLTLSAVHGMVWLRQRDAWSSAMFSLLALSTAIISAFDLAMMRAPGPEVYSEILRWYHVPVLFAFAATAGFIHFYLQSGRLWLAISAFALRALTLVLNLFQPANLNFKEISALGSVPFLGETVRVPLGVANPLMGLGQLSLLLLLVYAIDASIDCWKKDQKRRAITAGGSLAIFIALSSWHSALVYLSVIQLPVITGVFFLGVVAVMAYELSRDILRAVQLNRDLERERAILAAIFDGVPGMIYLYSPEGKLVRWNRRLMEDSGYSAEELSRLVSKDWFQPEDQASLQREWGRVLGQGTRGRLEVDMLLKGGRKVPYLLPGVPVHIDGKLHLTGVGIDMSEKVAMEMTLQQRQREIAHMNRVSTMGVLAASLAHELNQPLAAILSNARAASRLIVRPDPDLREIAHILDDIATEDQRAASVIQSLRAMMTNEPVKWSPVQMNQLVEATLLLVESELRARAIILQRELAPALPPVPGHAVQLQQVLLNLLVNAMQAIDRGGRINMQTSCHQDALHVVIHDSGPGIPPDKLPVIFDPFISLKERGMGMGLTVCREIIQHHGGSIRAENHPEGGAMFCFELPRRAEKMRERVHA